MGTEVQIETGVSKILLNAGNGPKVQAGDFITVHCTGYLWDEKPPKKFWSTHDSQPFEFQAGRKKVIHDWDVGCMTMVVGEKAKIIAKGPQAYGANGFPALGPIPQAYGANGFPAWGIGPNATLCFEIEIL